MSRRPSTRLYAPARPFAEAIENWRDHQRMTRTGRDLNTLARLANIDARRLRGYISGENQWVELVMADRISLALDVPLPVLAEDFKTMPAWKQEQQEQQQTAQEAAA
jgi:hypothetical protein